MTSEKLKILQAEMPDSVLIKEVERQITTMAETGGRSHVMCVPSEITDTDMILSELVRRFKESKISKKPMLSENEILKDAHKTITKNKPEYAPDVHELQDIIDKTN